MAPSAGIEPATTGLENRCSIQLSYEDVGSKDCGDEHQQDHYEANGKDEHRSDHDGNSHRNDDGQKQKLDQTNQVFVNHKSGWPTGTRTPTS